MSPMSAPRRCARCGQLCRGKCPTCDNWRGRGSSKAWARSKARTNDSRWRKVRARRLRDDPYCAFCGAIATTADHLDGTDCQWPVGLPCTRSRDVLVGGHVISLLVAS